MPLCELEVKLVVPAAFACDATLACACDAALSRRRSLGQEAEPRAGGGAAVCLCLFVLLFAALCGCKSCCSSNEGAAPTMLRLHRCSTDVLLQMFCYRCSASDSNNEFL